MKLKLNKLLATTALIIAGLGITTTSSYASEDRLLYDCEARGDIARGAAKMIMMSHIEYGVVDVNFTELVTDIIRRVQTQLILDDPTISSEELWLYWNIYSELNIVILDYYLRNDRVPDNAIYRTDGWFYTVSDLAYDREIEYCQRGGDYNLTNLDLYPSTYE